MGGHTKRVGSQRAMGKGEALGQDLLEDAVGSRALRLPWAPQRPGQPCQGLGRAVCSGATSCGEKPSSDDNKGARKAR